MRSTDERKIRIEPHDTSVAMLRDYFDRLLQPGKTRNDKARRDEQGSDTTRNNE